ncbi:MAG: helix-turn-helix transcriptional regulator [Kiritimatiellae bacterium]|nr:helix-turn-helix transcriptional regulator [Kiritimatiellia bacterium]
MATTVSSVLVRAEYLPKNGEFPKSLFERNSFERLVVLGQGDRLKNLEKIPGCTITHLITPIDRNDLLYALGLKWAALPTATEQVLTEKERMVVCMAVKGNSLKEMADELACTVSTVQSYKQRAMTKLGVSHLADLSVIAAAKGWRHCPCRKVNQIQLNEKP